MPILDYESPHEEHHSPPLHRRIPPVAWLGISIALAVAPFLIAQTIRLSATLHIIVGLTGLILAAVAALLSAITGSQELPPDQFVRALINHTVAFFGTLLFVLLLFLLVVVSIALLSVNF